MKEVRKNVLKNQYRSVKYFNFPRHYDSTVVFLKNILNVNCILRDDFYLRSFTAENKTDYPLRTTSQDSFIKFIH